MNYKNENPDNINANMRVKVPPNTICEKLPDGRYKTTYHEIDPETKELYKTRSEIPGPEWDGCCNSDEQVIIYHRNGNVKETYEIINNVRHGPYYKYSQNGTLIKTVIYDKGKKVKV